MLKENRVVLLLIFIFTFAAMFLASHNAGGAKHLIEGDATYYLKMFKALDDGTFSRKNFSHGIGFPLMGFVGSYQGNPFILFSTILFVITSYHLYLLLREIFSVNGSIASILLILFSAPFYVWHLKSVNNIVTSTLTIYLISIAIRGKHPSILDSASIGFLAGLDFASRYIDPFLLAPILLFIFYRPFQADKNKAIAGVLAFVIFFSCWVGVTFYFHKKYLGTFMSTPYAGHLPHSDRIGVGSEDISTHMRHHHFNNTIRNFYQVFIDPGPYVIARDDAKQRPLFGHMPYLFFLFVGFYYWLKRKKPGGLLIASLGTSFLLTFIFYCSFWAFTAHDIQYGCLRYLSGWYPVMGAISLFGIKRLYEELISSVGTRARAVYFTKALGAHLVILLTFLAIPLIDNFYVAHSSYSKDKWTVITSTNLYDAGKMIDNDLNTHWSTAGPMKAGDYIIIDTQRSSIFSQVRFDLRHRSENDFPWRLDALYSEDGRTYKKITDIKSDRQNHIWILDFSPIEARKFKFLVREGARNPEDSFQWVVYELDLLR